MFLNGSVLGFRDYGLLGVVAIMGPLVAAIALRPVDVRFVRGVCALLVPVWCRANALDKSQQSNASSYLGRSLGIQV